MNKRKEYFKHLPCLDTGLKYSDTVVKKKNWTGTASSEQSSKNWFKFIVTSLFECLVVAFF